MGLWDGNLRNSPSDIAIDSTLLLAIAVSYIPQIARIISSQSTHGISPYFILFNAIFSNIQLANALLLTARAWPTDKSPVLELIGNGQLRGSEAFGAVLGLIQVALQWAFSIILVMLYAAYPASSAPSASPSTTTRTSIPTTAFIHAALFLLPAVVIALPKPSPPSMNLDIFTGFSAIINTWVSLIFVALQFYPQYLELRRQAGDPGALSLLTLGIQAVVLILVAVRWLQRLGAPTWGRQAAPASYWFQWGWLPFNYIIGGVGCAVLLGMYLRARRGDRVRIVGEETPLLV